jgi:hypothetical protein
MMDKPKAPKKPTKPAEPAHPVTHRREVHHESWYLDLTLADMLEFQQKFDAKPDDVVFRVELWGREVEEMTISVYRHDPPTDDELRKYDQEMEKYRAKLALYEAKLIDYEIQRKHYEEELAEWIQAKEQRELIEIRKRLQQLEEKYGK